MASYPLFLSFSSQLCLLILKLFLIKQEIIRGEIELPAEWVPIPGTKIPSIWLKEGRKKKKEREKKISFGKEERFCLIPKLIPFAWGAEPTASSCICLPLFPHLVGGLVSFRRWPTPHPAAGEHTTFHLYASIETTLISRKFSKWDFHREQDLALGSCRRQWWIFGIRVCNATA